MTGHDCPIYVERPRCSEHLDALCLDGMDYATCMVGCLDKELMCICKSKNINLMMSVRVEFVRLASEKHRCRSNTSITVMYMDESTAATERSIESRYSSDVWHPMHEWCSNWPTQYDDYWVGWLEEKQSTMLWMVALSWFMWEATVSRSHQAKTPHKTCESWWSEWGNWFD